MAREAARIDPALSWDLGPETSDQPSSEAPERRRRVTRSWNDLRWAVEAAERIARSGPPPARPVRGGTLRWGDRISEPSPSPTRSGTASWDELVDLARARLFELETAAAAGFSTEASPSTHRASLPNVAWEADEPRVEIRTPGEDRRS